MLRFDDEEGFDAREPAPQLGHRGAAVHSMSRVIDAVDGDERLRRYLAKAVEHRGRAHVRRADCPDRAQAGAGEQGDDRLRNIGQIGRHAIAASYPAFAQRQGQRRALPTQFLPADLGDPASFVLGHDRRQAKGLGRIDMPKNLTGIVDRRAVEPGRCGQGLVAENGGESRGRSQSVEVPHAAPEPLQVRCRPFPHRGVVREAEPVLALEPFAVESDLRDRTVGRPGHAPAVQVFFDATANHRRLSLLCPGGFRGVQLMDRSPARLPGISPARVAAEASGCDQIASAAIPGQKVLRRLSATKRPIGL